MTKLLFLCIGFVVCVLCNGCEPTFAPTGSLAIDGAPFTPTTCHVLVRATGIELVDAGGTRVELDLPPATLRAFEDVGGTPSVTIDRGAGRPAVSMSTCGTMTLTGEGYHGSGKRAASGRMSLDCAGAASVEGELSFSGCF
jgi:hypothetical protein